MNEYLDHVFDRGFCLRCGAAEDDVHEHGAPCANATSSTLSPDDRGFHVAEEGGARPDTAAPALAETPAVSPSKATRACPYCAEEILAAARLCKHCSSKLDPLIVEEAATKPATSVTMPVSVSTPDNAPAVAEAAAVGPSLPGVGNPSQGKKGDSSQVGVGLVIGGAALALLATIVFVGSRQSRGVGGFSGDDRDDIAVGIANHWGQCGATNLTADGIRTLIGRNVWPDADANRCLLCLDEHPACQEQSACEAACRLPADEAPVSALATFGGSANPELFGTWESADPQNTMHLTLVFDADSYDFFASGPQGTQTRTGVWAAVRSGATWRVFMEPQDDPAAANVKTFDIVSPDVLRWADVQNGSGSVTWRRRPPVPAAPAVTAPAAPSSEHVNECNRACGPFRECMRDYEDASFCSDDLTRLCRTCRTEGLGRGRAR